MYPQRLFAVNFSTVDSANNRTDVARTPRCKRNIDGNLFAETRYECELMLTKNSYAHGSATILKINGAIQIAYVFLSLVIFFDNASHSDF